MTNGKIFEFFRNKGLIQSIYKEVIKNKKEQPYSKMGRRHKQIVQTRNIKVLKLKILNLIIKKIQIRNSQMPLLNYQIGKT